MNIDRPDSEGRRLFIKAALLSPFIAVPVLSAVGCTNGPTMDDLRSKQLSVLDKKGLLEKRPLVDLRNVPGYSTEGAIAGSFVGFTGNFEGQTTSMLRFGWQAKSEQGMQIIVSEIPYKRALFNVVDSEDVRPSVLFDFLLDPMMITSRVKVRDNAFLLDSDNPNDYLPYSKTFSFYLTRKQYDDLQTNPK